MDFDNVGVNKRARIEIGYPITIDLRSRFQSLMHPAFCD